MSVVQINKNPSRRDLLVFVSVLPVFFGLCLLCMAVLLLISRRLPVVQAPEDARADPDVGTGAVRISSQSARCAGAVASSFSVSFDASTLIASGSTKDTSPTTSTPREPVTPRHAGSFSAARRKFGTRTSIF